MEGAGRQCWIASGKNNSLFPHYILRLVSFLPVTMITVLTALTATVLMIFQIGILLWEDQYTKHLTTARSMTTFPPDADNKTFNLMTEYLESYATHDPPLLPVLSQRLGATAAVYRSQASFLLPSCASDCHYYFSHTFWAHYDDPKKWFEVRSPELDPFVEFEKFFMKTLDAVWECPGMPHRQSDEDGSTWEMRRKIVERLKKEYAENETPDSPTIGRDGAPGEDEISLERKGDDDWLMDMEEDLARAIHAALYGNVSYHRPPFQTGQPRSHRQTRWAFELGWLRWKGVRNMFSQLAQTSFIRWNRTCPLVPFRASTLPSVVPMAHHNVVETLSSVPRHQISRS